LCLFVDDHLTNHLSVYSVHHNVFSLHSFGVYELYYVVSGEISNLLYDSQLEEPVNSFFADTHLLTCPTGETLPLAMHIGILSVNDAHKAANPCKLGMPSWILLVVNNLFIPSVSFRYWHVILESRLCSS